MKKSAVFFIVITLLFTSSCSFIKKKKPAPETTSSEPLYVADINGDLVPAYKDVDTSYLDPRLFERGENGRMIYGDESVKLLTGIDVSVFQGEIDWQRVKADGIDFVMLRCGGRGYGESGKLYKDEKFRENCINANAAGLDVGVYFFSQAISEKEAREEAEYTLDMIDGLTLSFPIVFDWETVEDDNARTNVIKGSEVTDFAKAFCDTVIKAGYDSMVYLNCESGYFMYDLNGLNGYNIWLAEYSEIPSYYYHYRMWQYDTKGIVDGIDGYVDMNIAMKDIVSG